jgi:hypothetical protein
MLLTSENFERDLTDVFACEYNDNGCQIFKTASITSSSQLLLAETNPQPESLCSNKRAPMRATSKRAEPSPPFANPGQKFLMLLGYNKVSTN